MSTMEKIITPFLSAFHAFIYTFHLKANSPFENNLHSQRLKASEP